MSEVKTTTVHMIQMWLNSRQLVQLGKMLNLPLRKVGNNYLVHCALSELFQDQAPKLFSVEDNHRQISDYQGQKIRVLFYSEYDWQTLQKLAQGFASPTVYEIVDWEQVASKPMPTEFPDGLELRFEIRTCPVVRKASDGPKCNKGQEVDVFLSTVREEDSEDANIAREETHEAVSIRDVERRVVVRRASVRVKRCSKERMARRNHKPDRKVAIIQRTDVTVTGTLKIENGKVFEQLLDRGMGR